MKGFLEAFKYYLSTLMILVMFETYIPYMVERNMNRNVTGKWRENINGNLDFNTKQVKNLFGLK